MNTQEKNLFFKSNIMYSRNRFVFAAALIILAACQTEINNQKLDVSTADVEKVIAPEITAAQETGSPTKSVLEVDGEGVGTIYWTPADEINVFYGTTSTHYVSQNVTNATTAVFSTTDVIGSTESESTNIWGLYPYNSLATCTGSAVNTTLPATQYGVPGTFDDDLFITLAHNTSTALTFYNVCGGIKFSLSRDDIVSIEFGGNNSEFIAGDISVDFVDGKPRTTIVSGQRIVTLYPKTGSTFEAGVDYYITLLPVYFANGFSMIFRTKGGAEGGFVYNTKPVTIKRSIFGKKAEIDKLSSLPVPNNQIRYTSSDGQVVIPTDAQDDSFKNGDTNISIVSNEYQNGMGVITFSDEITKIQQSAFFLCTKLVTVNLPESITYLGTRAFASCSALTSISIPSGFEEFGLRALSSCSALTTISIPEGVNSIRAQAFASCTSLSSVCIPESVTSIEGSAFQGCTSLSSITVLGITPPTGGSNMFNNTNNAPIYVPAGSVDAYKIAEYWSDYESRIFPIP